MRNSCHLLLLLGCALPTLAVAQTPSAQAGPIVPSAGAVFPVAPDLPTPLDVDYRVAFDVSEGSGPERPSTSLNTVARFLNMHGQAGVPRENIVAAVVVHGSAVMDVLSAEAYHDRHGAVNPNATLLRELLAAGTRVIVCGQSAASRGVDGAEFMDGVETSLSAMTAFVVLQAEGYRVNPW
ncbi:MAG: DsrE family protein [Gemmatimonadota bacterium]